MRLADKCGGVDAGARSCNGRARAQGHDDFFQGGVAGAFADAVDGAFDLAGAVLDRGQRIGHGQAQVVVAMRGQNDVLLRRIGSLASRWEKISP
jgi:hypothetical protein